MKLLIVGATGGTGAALLGQAVSEGHDVTVITRSPEKLPRVERSSLTVVPGDVLRPGPWQEFASRNNTLLSCLGSTDRKQPTTVYSAGTLNILSAMGTSPTRRIVCLSSAGLDIAPGTPFLQKTVTRLLIQRLYRHGYADMRRMEAVLHAQDVRWTIVRPPMLTDKPASGRYRTAINTHVPNPGSIARADLAHYMLTAVEDPATWKSTVEISAGP
ncbi:NAD(P)-dependent oxidoreductase [Nocardia brevicatena]|uniref:NAD(P)-dependent oxidoreductase n=1 Tax=Nocardia brevicatena TaxID=37327 RepID=UPI0003042150|nr:NAD(P)H-binding protein [Nocardia brevicatena]